MNSIMPIFNLFWSICLIRKGPQDVPVSAALFALILGISLLLDVINLSIALPDAGIIEISAMVVIYTSVLIITLSALLYTLGYFTRNLQTLTALFGTGLIISLCALPVLIILYFLPERPSMFNFMLLVINLWSLVVTAHILSRALSVHILLAAVLAFGYFMLGFKVVDLFLPQGG